MPTAPQASTLTAHRVGGQLDESIVVHAGYEYADLIIVATLTGAEGQTVFDPTNKATVLDGPYTTVVGGTQGTDTTEPSPDGETTLAGRHWWTEPLKATTAADPNDALQPTGLSWTISLQIKGRRNNIELRSYSITLDADRDYTAQGETLTLDTTSTGGTAADEVVNVTALQPAPDTTPDNFTYAPIGHGHVTPDGSIPLAKLDTDVATQTELDAVAAARPKQLFLSLRDGDGSTADAIQAAFDAGEFAIGDAIQTVGYHPDSQFGGCTYRVVASTTGTDDGGSYIDFTGFQLEAVFQTGAIDVTQFGAVLDNSTDIATPLQAAVDFMTKGQILESGLMGGVLHIPGAGAIGTTIDLKQASITFQGLGGWTNPPNYNGSQNGGRGSAFRWIGAAGEDMFVVHNSQFCRWLDIRFEGNDTNIPRSAIHLWNDPAEPDGQGSNDGMAIERCHIGTWPWSAQGLHQGRFEYGVLVDGANANNDRLYMRDVDIRNCDYGIHMPNSQSVWGDFHNVHLNQCGTGLSTGASTQARNLQMQQCDRGIDILTGTAVWIEVLSAENIRELARIRGGGALFVRGGYSQVVDVNTDGPIDPSLNGYFIDATDTSTPYVQVVFKHHKFTNNGVPTNDIAKISVTPTSGGAGNFWPPLIALDDCIGDPEQLIDVTLADSQDQRIIRGTNRDGKAFRQHLNRNRTNASEAMDWYSSELGSSIVLKDTVTAARYRITVQSGVLTATVMP